MRIAFVGNFQVSFSSETHHANSLETLGHTVVRLQEAITSGEVILEQALVSDILVHVHTHQWHTPGLPLFEVFKRLKDAGIPTLTYHLDLWFGLQRQHDLENDEFYKHIGHFFTVDKLMADWFNDNTEVEGHYIHAGVYDKEAFRYKPSTMTGLSLMPAGNFEIDTERKNDVVFVGSKGYHPEWQYRPQLVGWLEQTYGERFKHAGGDSPLGIVRGHELNQFYADSKVVVGDTLCLNFDYPYYWSDRVYETLGRGGFMIHPYIKGMEDDFEDGKHLVFYKYGDFADLKSKIDYYIEHDDEREAIRRAGHEHVAANHTYLNRWQTIIDTVMNGDK